MLCADERGQKAPLQHRCQHLPLPLSCSPVGPCSITLPSIGNAAAKPQPTLRWSLALQSSLLGGPGMLLSPSGVCYIPVNSSSIAAKDEQPSAITAVFKTRRRKGFGMQSSGCVVWKGCVPMMYCAQKSRGETDDAEVAAFPRTRRVQLLTIKSCGAPAPLLLPRFKQQKEMGLLLCR